MARKDVFAKITGAEAVRPERKAVSGYAAAHGASRSMMTSLGELAEKAARAERLLEGAAIVDLDPAVINASFVTDRMDDDPAGFADLMTAIAERGQDTPILVRTHPAGQGRFQVVFGHRRLRAAERLGRPVRAIVRDISDVEHVIAQGQENSAREDLTFIERAMFAQRLLDLGFERGPIQQALCVDAPMLSRMVSVTARVPAEISLAIGAAQGIGRDRWLELAQLLEHPANLSKAVATIRQDSFARSPSDARFGLVLSGLKKLRRPRRDPADVGIWEPDDKGVTAEFKNTGRSFSLSLKARSAGSFGKFLSENLERLYEEFRTTEKTQGD